MVGRFVSPRLFAGVVFSSIQLLILVVGFTYQADAEARCRGGSCRVQRFQPFQRFQQPMRSCSGRGCGQPVMSSCGPGGCGQSGGGCGMRRVCGSNGCSMVSSCGGGQSCGPNGCSTRVAGSSCGPNGCSTNSNGGRLCSTCGTNGCSSRGCSTQGLSGISPTHAGAVSLLGIGNEALSRGVSGGLGALQDQGTVQACGGGVNWYNRSRGNWEPANICLSVNNQQLPIILNANGELQLSDQTGNLEPLSDNHSRALAATYRKNGVQHQFMPALQQRFPEQAASNTVAQTDSAAPQSSGPQPAEQGTRNPASGLSETVSTQPAQTKKMELADTVISIPNTKPRKLDVASAVAAVMQNKDAILSAIQSVGKGDTVLVLSQPNCGPCIRLKAAIAAIGAGNVTQAQLDDLKTNFPKVDVNVAQKYIFVDPDVIGQLPDAGLSQQIDGVAQSMQSVPHIYR